MTRLQARQDAQLLRGALPLLALRLLQQKTSYGYELVERLVALGLDVSTGLVYPVLNRLERDALITATSAPSPSGPPRKYFSLTDSGVAAVDIVTSQWEQLAAAVSGIIEHREDRHAADDVRDTLEWDARIDVPAAAGLASRGGRPLIRAQAHPRSAP